VYQFLPGGSIFTGTFTYVHGKMSLVHNAKGSCTSLANGSSRGQYNGYGDCIQYNLLPDMGGSYIVQIVSVQWRDTTT
jgi:hypothetical protein